MLTLAPQPYDRITSVGGTTRGEDLGDVIAASVNKPLEVVIQRMGIEHVLSLVPRTWKGPGLLGCRLLVLS